MELRVSAAILAGGRARRLGGADKASLAIGHQRIIDRQLAALAGLTDDLRIVANDARHDALGVRRIADTIADCGPLGGIYSALLDARHRRVIVLACDLPFVTRDLLRLIAEAGREEDDAVMPRSARGLEPLCACYHTRVASIVRPRIDRRELDLMSLAQTIRVRELGSNALAGIAADQAFENVNTPHDYERARRLIERNEKPLKDRITE
ncbi:MAG: molybdenum cofactor guanylyltransferase [Vicinamibacterales bacterium]